MDDILSDAEQVPMPYSRQELSFGLLADVNAKALCFSLAGTVLGMKELYECVPASEVFEMYVLRTIDQYYERVLHKRKR